MIRVTSCTGLAVLWLAISANPVAAQYYFGNPYWGYGAWGGYPLGQYNTTREIASQDRAVAQDRAIGANRARQTEIQNALTSQAQSRSNAILAQREANRDWWFQTQQQQQTAQRQARDYRAPVATPAGFGLNPAADAFDLAEPPAKAATDIIAWPKVLREDAFDSQRAEIEAPYRRASSGLSVPTPEDFRKMAATVEEMKAILEWRLGVKSGLRTEDYEQAKAFLNQLAQEAIARAGAGGK